MLPYLRPRALSIIEDPYFGEEKEHSVRLIDPKKNPVTPTPDHTGVTSREIAGRIVGARSCEVKLGVYEPGGRSIVHSHPHSEHVLYILEGQLTLIDGAKNELTAVQDQALYVPAGEVHMAENRGAGRTLYIAVTAPPTA
jgi:quercetin dioxygenase-like cupin family protein